MTKVDFPLDLHSTPAPYGPCSWRGPSDKRNGAHELADTVTIRLTKAGATSYEMIDYFGNVVSSGSMSAAATTLIPTVPAGGWKYGSYTLLGSGPINDPVWGHSYFVTTVTIVRTNANLPAFPAGDYSADYVGDQHDAPGRACMGIAPGRLEFPQLLDAFFTINGSYTTPDPDSWLAKIGAGADFARSWWLDPAAHAVLDPVRPRYLWCAFGDTEHLAVDRVILPAATGSYLSVYMKDDTSHDPTQVFVSIGAGSSSGTKIKVYYPDSSTVVETFDDQATVAAAQARINLGVGGAASNYIRAFRAGVGTETHGTLAATAIGNTIRTKVVGAVSYLYGKGVTHFEGPTNEPDIAEGADVGWEHIAKLFQAYVHAGNASAKAIGPCPVNIESATWEPFLTNGGGSFLDAPSGHDYNSMTAINLPLGRHKLTQFAATLAEHGLAIADFWQTEANTVIDKLFGVYHVRLAAYRLLHTLLWEQFGVPRERNVPWYDGAHGFNEWPAWLENGDGSLTPDCAMLRVLAEETWGQTHNQILDFGAPGNDIFLGSVYAGTAGKTAVVMMGSPLPGATVTFTTSATGTLTVVDGFGNESTVTVAGGRVRVPVAEIPTYLRLPASATVSVYTVNDWPQIGVNGQGYNASVIATGKVGSVATPIPTQAGLMTDYATATGAFLSSGSLPEPIDLAFAVVRLDRVIISPTPASQSESTITKFAIETSNDGTTWTTQPTAGPDGIARTPVDVTADATSIVAGSDSNHSACARITWWRGPSVFDEKLAAPVVCRYARVNVLATSYGGEPDAASHAANGQGNAAQHISIQRVACLCDNNTIPHYGAHL